MAATAWSVSTCTNSAVPAVLATCQPPAPGLVAEPRSYAVAPALLAVAPSCCGGCRRGPPGAITTGARPAPEPGRPGRPGAPGRLRHPLCPFSHIISASAVFLAAL